MKRPYEEPCGCNWGSADFPSDATDCEPFTEDFVECYECGAVWTAKQDNAWVLNAERAS